MTFKAHSHSKCCFVTLWDPIFCRFTKYWLTCLFIYMYKFLSPNLFSKLYMCLHHTLHTIHTRSQIVNAVVGGLFVHQTCVGVNEIRQSKKPWVNMKITTGQSRVINNHYKQTVFEAEKNLLLPTDIITVTEMLLQSRFLKTVLKLHTQFIIHSIPF